ncbi:MAG: type II secretion system protein [Bacteroidota bacterium]|nr:type II secretion system protein [Bacteroidota bacterium]
MLTKKIKAFTLAEILVTLALTSIVATFSFMGYTLIQKLLKQYNDQNFFITQINALNNRIHLMVSQHGTILKESENKFVFSSDTTLSFITFNNNSVLLNRFNKTDTFKLKPEKLNAQFEPIKNPDWQNKMVNAFEFDIYFQEQRFHLAFNKNYDAYSKLLIEKENKTWLQ